MFTDCDARHNRSTLRKQKADDNHIPELEKALGALAPNHAGETPLCYALAKELEDLREYERAFAHMKRGADSYRRRLRYDVQVDVSIMKRIAELFDTAYAEKVKAAPERRGYAGPWTSVNCSRRPFASIPIGSGKVTCGASPAMARTRPFSSTRPRSIFSTSG